MTNISLDYDDEEIPRDDYEDKEKDILKEFSEDDDEENVEDGDEQWGELV